MGVNNQLYNEKVIENLKNQLGTKNILALPRITKVVVNVGIRQEQNSPEILKTIASTLSRITGQKPVKTLARKSIASFKIREGMEIGMKVTLRGKRMYDFMNKLINITLPRARDFRGLSEKSVDDQGNLSVGFPEHIVFPEINADEVERLHGVEVVIVTTAGNKANGIIFFKALGFPFAKIY